MKYQLKVGDTIVQRSNNIMDLQRIAGNLGYSHYAIYSNFKLVYSI